MQIICHGLKEEDFLVEFTDHIINLGRDESNSVVIKAEGVSRFHAILIEEGDGLFLQDNDSRNGTFLNYKQVRGKQKLVNGDIIQIGYRLIRMDFLPEQKIILDFVPPEQTELVPNESADVSPVSPPSSPDDIDRTMVASDTMLSRSSMPDKNLLPSGSEIGKYVIIKRLGKGGMGEVYLAQHKTLGICRALKMLPKDVSGSDAVFLERFIREAKLASEIRHPNVVGVMDVETDSDSGYPYIVMEYVDGGSLRDSLSASKSLSEEQAVVIVEAVASALKAAEAHNIVHRDIKPDNIMFTRQGEVKLADLGIAKVDGQDTDLTKTNMMIGTPAYLPPEQAQNAKAVDARADIYSLGATFYEMLTGETPYPGDSTIEILHKLILSPVPDPRKINPDVSPASATIVMKMLAKDPKVRFQNATELLNKMEHTFPPHTASEAAELIQKAIAGVSQSNDSFSSGISSSRLSLWWLKLPNKWFVLSAAGFVFAICILCILFLFLDKTPARTSAQDAGESPVEMVADTDTIAQQVEPEVAETAPAETAPAETAPVETTIAENAPVETTVTETAPVETTIAETVPVETAPPEETVAVPIPKTYKLQIKTTPGSEIYLTSPDEWIKMYSADQDGLLKLSELEEGKYKVKIMRDGYRSLTREFELEDNLMFEAMLNIISLGDNPFIVTTDQDIVDPYDGMTSLREAIDYAQSIETNVTVSFWKDCRIKLNSALVISRPVTINGGTNDITVIGPEADSMFHVSDSPDLKLKNLTLISNRSGDGMGIMDISSSKRQSGWFEGNWSGQLVELVSVKDGGTARNLWTFENIGVKIDGGSHIHRLAKAPRSAIKIFAGSVLEDSILAGAGEGVTDSSGFPRGLGNYLIYGSLKNSTVLGATLWIYPDGVCENLTVGQKAFLSTGTGTVNGLKVEFGGLFGYEPGSVLNGTVSISGAATAQDGMRTLPTILPETDLVFDLTERTEGKGFSLFRYAGSQEEKKFEIKKDDPILDDMKAFREARSYTVQVKNDQPVGAYKLAGNAAGFNFPLSLKIGNDMYSKALSVGKRYAKDGKEYSLSLAKGILILTIK